jgi:C1A family cysteine protease
MEPAVPRVRLGWYPDMRDHRDYTLGHGDVKAALEGASQEHLRLLGLDRAAGEQVTPGGHALPAKVDLRSRFAQLGVDNQKNLGSCTAQAVSSLVEYLCLQGTGEQVDMSRLFIYKLTRRLLGWTGDTGAFIRATIKAMVTFGAPPENCWPYDVSTFDNEPDAFQYSYANNYKSQVYARLDSSGAPDGKAVLNNVKRCLAAGFPVAFGFSVYGSIPRGPDFPFPKGSDRLLGGHAVLAVGYDDNRPAKGPKGTANGALIIRNSWGPAWGEGGYGYLPYQYVLDRLATDFWTIFKQGWVPTPADITEENP